MATTPFHLTDADRATLAMTDEDFIPHTWTDLKQAITANDLSTLRRMPSTLRRYIAWSQQTMVDYGSTATFLLQKRLFWESSAGSQSKHRHILPENPIPFANSTDYKILYNDWPYGLTSDITHLVVWLKTPLTINAEDGKMTPESKDLVHEYVSRTFGGRMKLEGSAEDCVVYFKNVPLLQSVGTLEHFHVLIRGAKRELLYEWTGGDVPMYKM